MKTKTLRRKICIPSAWTQDADLTNRLYDKINDTYLGICTKTDGYILGIDKEIDILDNQLTVNGSVMVDVQFTVNVLKPEVGQVWEGRVCMVFEDGIFLEIKSKMNVLIPATSRPDLKYNKEKNCFKIRRKTITVNDTIKVRLEQIKYEKRAFSCIGSFVI